MNDQSFSRRDFVKFMGGSVAAVMATSPALLLSSCKKDILLQGISPSSLDDLVLAPGLQYQVLIKWQDRLSVEDTFGFNNDYTAFFELSDTEAIMWMNHEYPHPMFVNGFMRGQQRTKEQVDKERYAVGGSLVHIKKDKNDRWSYIENSQYNRRITATTEIPIIAPRDIKGSRVAIGTFAGCAGGVTPWNTVLSCEENYQDYYGDYSSKGKYRESKFKWDDFYKLPPEHYGWVVEVDPQTGSAKKLTAMGRFSHEGATTTVAKDGRVVVYSGDDKANEHIYKFISKTNDSLDEGELFVANLEKGQWLSLDWSKSKILQENFKDQLDVLIFAREAAKLLGATPCDRPEDVEINPKTKDVLVCLTNNYDKKDPTNPNNNYYGKILKISETNADPLSMTFAVSDFAVGGNESGFACPDNMIFDHAGNLWMTTDISGDMVGKGPYEKFKNNGLFYFPLSGKDAGKIFQMGSAPVDAELTGLSLSTDKKSLFLSVQHPGEKSKSLSELSSHWPNGGNEIPRPAVVQIFGPLFDKLNG